MEKEIPPNSIIIDANLLLKGKQTQNNIQKANGLEKLFEDLKNKVKGNQIDDDWIDITASNCIEK